MTPKPISHVEAQLVVKNDLSELKRMSDWVNQWSQEQRLADNVCSRLDLCSTEVLTNIISYACSDSAEHAIALRLRRCDRLVNLEVEDDGNAFNPLQVQAPAAIASLDDARITGWGIPLVRKFSDAADYRRADGRNYLTLSFQCIAPA